MRMQNIFTWSAIGALSVTLGGSWLTPSQSAFASTASASPVESATPQISPAQINLAQMHIAQVNNADLACYLRSLEGVQYDLSALCGGFTAQEVVLQTGDVQVTLRWDTSDDLDLYVQDPFGDEVYFGNPAIASGGLLDVDANAGCTQQMAAPVENIFWPTGGGKPGDYVVTVDLFSYCGDEVPINFTLTTLVQGETQTQTGTVSNDQRSVSFPFTFSESGDMESGEAISGGTPDATRVQALPTIAPAGQAIVPAPTEG